MVQRARNRKRSVDCSFCFVIARTCLNGKMESVPLNCSEVKCVKNQKYLPRNQRSDIRCGSLNMNIGPGEMMSQDMMCGCKKGKALNHVVSVIGACVLNFAFYKSLR